MMEYLLSLQKIKNCTGILFISFILNIYRMEKLTKSEFGLSSKHELWNRSKSLKIYCAHVTLRFFVYKEHLMRLTVI